MKQKKRAIVYTFIIAVFTAMNILFLPYDVLAQNSTDGLGCGGGLGPFAEIFCAKDKATATNEAGTQLNNVISIAIGVMTIVAALWFLFQLLLAGYTWIGAGGDKTRTEAAWHKITNALLGLVIVVFAWVLVGVVGKIIGVDILNPGGVIQNLGN